MTRREFLPLLAAGLPMPPGTGVLRSPRDSEFVDSLKKVHSVSFEAVAAPTPTTSGPGLIVSIQNHGDIATLSWSGLSGPYIVEQRESLAEPWEQVGNATLESSMDFPVFQSASNFFRVKAKSILQTTATPASTEVRLSWPTVDP